jgi:hypothetical protein
MGEFEGWVVKAFLLLLGALISLVGYLLKKRIDDAEHAIIARVPDNVCKLLHGEAVKDIDKLNKHRHAPTIDGKGGEVIL